MLIQKQPLTQAELDEIKKLKDFIPDKVFDSHSHIYDSEFTPTVHPEEKFGKSRIGAEEYKENMSELLGNTKILRANYIIFPDKSMALPNSETLKKSDVFLKAELDKDPLSVGEIIVRPIDTAEDIEKRLIHKNIRGLKCYHYLAQKDETWNLDIEEYLPESAWEVAKKHNLVITLHMVKDLSLADPNNFNYIVRMAKKYPTVNLILAHCGRSFASWTIFEPIKTLAKYENIWFDFSSICEPSPMMAIMKQLNVERCMWGTDSPISNYRGRAVSFAGSFHWFYDTDFIGKDMNQPKQFYTIGVESLMATKQACDLLDLSPKQIEDFFYNNANLLWK